MSTRICCLSLLTAISLVPAWALAQPPGGGGPQVVSPEVADDRKVTFRILAPEAKAVRLTGGDLPNLGQGVDLKKGDNGVWEAAVGPVPAGAYRYTFNVDGVAVVDPRNSATSESNGNTASLVYVPGSEISDTRDVPHGAVAEVTYKSKSLDRFRRMHVYTPPGYEHGDEKYPVFYLLHGAFDCDDAWTTVGRAGFILDNLIAAGKAKPMIVVMPAGHTGPFRFGPGGDFERQMGSFESDFNEDVRPYIEANYRLLDGRENRALAGLSMGGAQTLNLAIANLEDYGYLGVFSSGVFGIAGGGRPGQAPQGPSWEERNKAALDNAAAKNGLELVWFATGKDDFLLGTSQGTVKMLRDHGFDVVYEETDGGHTWDKWRDYLAVFAPQLFQDKPAAK